MSSRVSRSVGLAFLAALGTATLLVSDVRSQRTLFPRSPGGGVVYSHDDGLAEGGIACPSVCDLAWLVRFDALDGADSLVSLDVILGHGASSVPDGTPLNLCVWDDPDNDGNPDDAILLTNVRDTVKNSGLELFTSYVIPPTVVTGVFYVGCYLTTNFGVGVMGWDGDSSAPGRAWLVANTAAPGTFDPTCLPCNEFGPWDIREEPFNIFGTWMVRANGEGCGGGATHCTAKTNSCGVLPTIYSVGVPSVSSGEEFVVAAAFTKAEQPGLVLYSDAGRAALPFDGGLLCLQPPLRRSVVVTDVSGTPGQCDGVLSLDMNAFAAGALGGNPAAFLSVPGTTVGCQWWGRDKVDHGSLLSDALEFTVCQ